MSIMPACTERCAHLQLMLVASMTSESCAEVLVAAFRDYPALRPPLMDEVISGVLTNVDPQLRTFPVGDYHMHMVSALVLQMLQVGSPCVSLFVKLEMQILALITRSLDA